jgi:hypothetical protein
MIADTRHLELSDDGQLSVSGVRYQTTPIFHEQVRNRLKIPAKYYNRLRADHPSLLATNVNTLFQQEPERRLVRAMTSNGSEPMPIARAFLSNRFRIFDNWQVADAVLPVLSEVPEVRMESTTITDRRLYLKAVFPRIQGEVRVGDVVQAGVVISNSEIGFGRSNVELLLYRLVCSNGMVSPEYKAGRHHVGRMLGGNDDDDSIVQLLSDETMRADDAAFSLKLRDLVRAATNEDIFREQLQTLRNATKDEILQSPIDAVQMLASKYPLQESEQSDILTHLLQDGDLTRYGLSNAITRASQDVDDYDRATDLERMGGLLAHAQPKDATWQAIAGESKASVSVPRTIPTDDRS